VKAAVLTGVRQFETRELPEPVAPEDGLVLDVRACGICGSDLRRWKEGPPAGSDGIVPGHEAAGVVAAVGCKTMKFAVGNRLAIAPDIHCGKCYYCRRGMFNLCDDLRLLGITPGYPGGFAERIVLTREVLDRGIVHRMPDGLSFDHAAVSEPCCSVLACHDDASTGHGDTVVVLGAGPVGCLHVFVARSRRAKVIVSEPNPVRRQLAERFGPEKMIDPLKDNAIEAVKRWTGGVGADVVICANPIAQTQTDAVMMVRKGGKVMLFGGLPKADPWVKLDGNRIHYGQIQVIGSFSYLPAMHATALELLSRGRLPADKLITHSFSLDQIGQAYETAAGGDALKVIIRM
jgi:L-iditol 2-dehydrogenase